MPQLCNLRRQRPSEAQLDLFSSMFGAEAVAPVIVPELPPIIAEPPFAEPEATPAMADTTEQTTIVECDPFIIDLPDPLKPPRDFSITDDHRIGVGTLPTHLISQRR